MMRNRCLTSQRSIASLLIVAVATTGCVKTREYKVARYAPHGQPITQPIPSSATHAALAPANPTRTDIAISLCVRCAAVADSRRCVGRGARLVH